MHSKTNLPSASVVALRNKNWALSRKFDQNIYSGVEGIEIELRWSVDRSSRTAEAIYIQQTLMPSLKKAKEYLRHIICSARCLKKLNLNIQVSTENVVDELLTEFLLKESVKLEELHIRRRYVGQHLSAISKLVRENIETLKVIGKIGISEAIESFNGYGEIHLKRLSLFNFDLVDKDGELNGVELARDTRFFILRLAGLGRQGLSFEHLSFTSYQGLEITKMPALHMLRHCKVKSLRVTMQSGVALLDPVSIQPLLPELRRLELVGTFECSSNNISKLFPALEYFSLQPQDLQTGLVQRARVLSLHVPDVLHEANMSPVAAAC